MSKDEQLTALLSKPEECLLATKIADIKASDVLKEMYVI